MSKGVLTVISGFSGAGKGTIMKELIQKYQYFVSISATTRQPRAGEENGREYYFYDREKFESMIANDQLIEWAEYVGNYYGTPREAVEKQLNEGKDVLLEIEMQGGMLVKEQFPDAVLIFITPPSAQELKDRLCGRGTETEEQIANRLARASEEVPYMKSYEYLVVNDDLDEAVEHVHQIITTQHAKMKYHEFWIEQMETTLDQFHK